MHQPARRIAAVHVHQFGCTGVGMPVTPTLQADAAAAMEPPGTGAQPDFNSPDASALERTAGRLSASLARATDAVAAVLLMLLVLDVWLGVVARYFIPLPITFMEEAARYLMIWVALLAVSSCIPRREHIGVQEGFRRFPAPVRRGLLAVLDAIGIAFFVFLAFYGLGLVERGGRTFTMINGLSKALPFAAVPVGAGLAALQLLLVAVRDQARLRREPTALVYP